ncbi:hypothetical protein CGLO_17805 [Colletotrichum gloeosporioides Cg-14]|uniref:Uncharacterized protein n=1 Tax=Colletotrichum gloeosporioides (strain Cg-14) TaxID=1237896 RepID=T0JSV2_COLGC|nr:hypothetical protein CGLO_17805 [Colletotrichum gloeosporioides Cg-14]
MEKAITKLGDQYDRKKQAERIVSEQLFGGDREFIYW